MSLVKFDEDVNGVWDMISHQGRTCALISSGPWKTTELIVEDERISIDLPPRSEMLSCRLFSSGNEICIEGPYADEKGNISSGIWVEGQEYMIFETGQSIAGLCSSVLVHRKSRNTSRGILYSSGNMITSQRRLQPNAKAPSLKII